MYKWVSACWGNPVRGRVSVLNGERRIMNIKSCECRINENFGVNK